jgi:hypothetical protein
MAEWLNLWQDMTSFTKLLKHILLHSRVHSTFHVPQLLPYHENDDNLFLLRELLQPEPIVTVEGLKEYFINQITNEQPHG